MPAPTRERRTGPDHKLPTGSAELTALILDYGAGMKMAELCAKHGVTPPTIRASLDRAGVHRPTKRKKKGRKARKEN